MTDAATSGTTETTTAKPKRAVHRKPLWLAMPLGFEEASVVDAEGNKTGVVKKPTGYTLVRCESKKEVTKVLNDAGIDITADEMLAHVRLFRADPIELQVDRQVTVKF